MEKAREVFPEYDYSRSVYSGCRELVEFDCPEHGPQRQKAYLLLSGRGCSRCPNRYFSRKPNKPLDIQELKRKFPGFELDISSYKSSMGALKVRCLKCGNIFERSVNSLRSKSAGCPWCSGRYKGTEQLKQRLEKFYGDNVFDFSKAEYSGSRNNVEIICRSCGQTFCATPHSLLSRKDNGVRCPFCNHNISKGEKRIMSVLESVGLRKDIDYHKEKMFPELKSESGTALRYDFYIPSRNLLVEYNGEQHYAPKKIFGGEKELRVRRHHDWLKRKYAKKHGLKLLIIPYTRFNMIEEMLKEELCR